MVSNNLGAKKGAHLFKIAEENNIVQVPPKFEMAANIQKIQQF